MRRTNQNSKQLLATFSKRGRKSRVQDAIGFGFDSRWLKNWRETVIGGFRSDLSITRKTDGNFGNVSAGVLFSKLAPINENGSTVICKLLYSFSVFTDLHKHNNTPHACPAINSELKFV